MHCISSVRLRHPDFPGVEEQYRYKNFASSRETKRRTQMHEAEINMEADIDEEGAFDAMWLSYITSTLSN